MCQTGAKQQSEKFGNRGISKLSLYHKTKTEIWKQREVFEGSQEDR